MRRLDRNCTSAPTFPQRRPQAPAAPRPEGLDPHMEHLEPRLFLSGGLSFAPLQQLGVGLYPDDVCVGDFDGNGRSDLAVTHLDGSVSVLLGNGDGSFKSKKDRSLGVNLEALRAGDFNKDGYWDLAAVGSLSSGTVSVLLSNGDGTFQAKADYAVGAGPKSVCLGDFNGDGASDLVVANSSTGYMVSVLLGKGNGTFHNRIDYAAGSEPLAVRAADFNGDARTDLVVVNHSTETASVLLGKGDGSFADPVSYPVGFGPVDISVADLNADGRLDLAVANNEMGDDLCILLGAGDGTFGTKTYVDTAHQPYAVNTGDLNGDNKIDLVVCGDNSLYISIGNGNGTFQPKVSIAAGATPYSPSVGDFNNDGKSDLTVGNFGQSTLSVLLNTSEPFVPPVIQFAASGFSVKENKKAARITVTRSGDAATAVSISCTTAPGTAKANLEYKAVSPTLRFAAGQITSTVVVPIMDDTVAEPDKTIRLVLSNPASGAVLGSQATAILTIRDNDDRTPPTARLGRLAAAKAGRSMYRFSVKFADNVLLNRATIGFGNILIIGSQGYKQSATLLSATPAGNAKSITAIYQVAVPGEIWDAADNGTYAILLQARRVRDAQGNPAPRQQLGSFKVAFGTKQTIKMKRADPDTGTRQSEKNGRNPGMSPLPSQDG